MRAKDFDTLDANQDARLSQQEFRGQQTFASFDWNRDGAVTKGEFLASHQAMFMKFDADADGRISLAEFAQAQQAAATTSMQK